MSCRKKARQPIIFVLIGIFLSVFASEVNAYLRNILPMSTFEITIIVTPIFEEILKALPILFFATVLAPKKEALFTASMAVGIGFAVLENAFYMLTSNSFNMFDAIIRAFGAGLMHGMCTLLVGVGILFVRKKYKLFVVGTFAMLSTAITYTASTICWCNQIFIYSDTYCRSQPIFRFWFGELKRYGRKKHNKVSNEK